jgi:chromosomal replication initiation ATPase DnaA
MDNLRQNETVDITAESLWDKTKEILKAKFKTKVKYTTWIEPLKVASFENYILTLYSPNEFSKQIFERNYQVHVAEMVKDIVGKAVKITVIQNPDIEKDIW